MPFYRCSYPGESSPSVNVQSNKQATTTPSANYSGEYTQYSSAITPDSGYDAMAEVQVRVPMIRDNNLLHFDVKSTPGTVYKGDTSQANSKELIRVAPYKNGMIYTASYLYVDPDEWGGGGGGGSTITEETLYTNGSPTSTQGDATLSLSQSLNDYDYIRFEYRKSITNSDTMSYIVSVDEFKQTGYSNGYAFVGLSAYMASSVAWCRPVYYNTLTTVSIKTPRRLAYTETSNNSRYCILVKIVGIKVS